MRKQFLTLLIGVVSLAACSDSTSSEAFSISGTWRSVSFPGAEFSMTIVETARAVEGAGHRTTPDATDAFRITGANAGRNASLLLDFDGQPDINFEGDFERADGEVTLTGALFGGGYEGQAIVFEQPERN